jgi:teichuronic acid biosynthesis glycosyltransferase TuaG
MQGLILYFMNKVSVVICTYNDNVRFDRALLSALSQTYIPFEVIIVDDFSESPIVISKSIADYATKVGVSIKLHRNTSNVGIGVSRRSALKMCDGEYIAFLDSDDYWAEDKLSVAMPFFQIANVLLVCHKTSFLKTNHEQSITNLSSAKYQLKEWYFLLYKSLPQTSGVIIKNPSIINFKEMRYAEDIDFFMRYAIASKTKILILDNVLGYCDRPQLTDGGLSGNRISMRFRQLLIYIALLTESFCLTLFSILIVLTFPFRIFREWLK